MSEQNLEPMETELRRLRPARAPEAFLGRLQESVRMEPARSKSAESIPAARAAISSWRAWLKRLIPLAGATVMLALLLVFREKLEPAPSAGAQSTPTQIIEEVELDQQLVAAFEGVAEMPGGLPVRFRCYDWQEALTLRNANGATEIEQRGPRLEIVPVSFDVY